MIDLGRLTVKCTDCPQIIPIAGDLTMNGENRHIYRLGYKGAQSFGVKVRLPFKRTNQFTLNNFLGNLSRNSCSFLLKLPITVLCKTKEKSPLLCFISVHRHNMLISIAEKGYFFII